MRMKLNNPGQVLLVAAASIGVAGLLSACNQITGTLTADFVYVASAKAAGPDLYGEIDVFEVNSQSGHMRQLPSSPFVSGGRNPVAEAVSSDSHNLYVVNHDDNTIVQFIIGNDGKLYSQQTINTPGVFPMAIAIAGTSMFVADTYQPLPTCSPASPCSGSIAMYPLAANGGIGSAAVNAALTTNYWPLTLPGSANHVIVPTAIASAPSGATVFVSAYDANTNLGYIFGFAAANGTLSPLNGGVPVAAGVRPSGMTIDAAGTYLYVTDSGSDNVMVFSASANGLTPVAGSPFPAGNMPTSIAVDANSKFAYVANGQDSTITAYSVSNGTLTRIATIATGSQPVAIGIDPALNQYLYTANFLESTVSGFQINANDGTLLNSQFSPFRSNANPTAIAAIAHSAVAK